MRLLLGIDLGTSYFKVGLFDETGGLRGLGRVAVDKVVRQPGYCELEVSDFWRFLHQALAAALAQAQAGVGQIAGLSYSSQANSFLLLGAQNEPLTPLVIWTDTRADPLDKELAAFACPGEFGRRTGIPGLSGRSAVAKWRWFRDRQPDIWSRMRRVMTMSDYLVHALTGELVGDAGTAALLGIYDLTERRWWAEALAVAGVGEGHLVKVSGPGRPGGRTRSGAGDLLGLPPGIPVGLGSLDHHVAALGAGVGTLGEVGISTGTVLAALTITDEVVPQSSCYHGPHFDGRRFYRLIFDPAGAGQLEEYRRVFAPEQTLEQLMVAAAATPAALPPDRGDRARGEDHGIGMRRLLEQIAFAQRCLVSRLAGGAPVKRVVAGGGGARSGFWLQMKADMMGLPLITPHSPESACLGAAMLAAVAAGWHPTPAGAARAMMQPGKEFLPDPVNAARYQTWIAALPSPGPGR